MTLLTSDLENIIVGKEVYYNGDIKLVASNYSKIYIGSYCAIGDNLKIIGLSHDYNYPALQGTFYKKKFNDYHPGEKNEIPTKERTKGDIIIGNDVYIGDDVTIMSGVKIGDGSYINSKSFVSKDIPAYSICEGIPCKVSKSRYSRDVVKFLQELKWWDWDKERIALNKNFFYTNLNDKSLHSIKKLIR